jgi:chromosome segregation ATPase
MPPEGFLGLVGDLFGCTVEEIADFSLPDEEPAGAVRIPATAPAAPARRARAASSDHETDDAEVLRQYLRIKEEQLEIAESERSELGQEHERVQKEAHALQARLREMEHQHEELAKKVAQMELARDSAHQEKHRSEEDQGRAERAHLERIRSLETQLASAGEKYENLRVRVRKDIRKIRENERELEARLELLRKDSATLLQARDEKVLEMQRKIDAMEFDLDQVQDGRVQAQMEAERYLAKLARVARALNVATGMIEDDHVAEEELEELEPISGGAALAEEPAAAAPAASTASVSMAAEPPPPDEPAATEELPEELANLANDGEPTQMIDADALRKMGGDGE